MAAATKPEDASCASSRQVIVIAGSTGVGKSASAYELAELLPGHSELISADSVQLYKFLDIGSNKPSEAERARCAHHLVDWVDPREPCTAGDWTREALRIVTELHARQATPIVCGGSCMYLDWFVHGEPSAGKADPELRAQISAELRPFEENLDWDAALALLPDAPTFERNNWVALRRRLETARVPVQRDRSKREGVDLRCFFLCPGDRRALFEKIDQRCIKMMRLGLLEEVVSLLERDLLDSNTPAGLSIGYRQASEYLRRPNPQEGDFSAFARFLRSFGTVTRNYAKQQCTWFMKDAGFMWIPADPSNPRAVAERILSLVALNNKAFVQARESDRAIRDGLAEQGPGMANYHSVLAEPEPTPALLELLQIADACTKRVPERHRSHAAPAVRLEFVAEQPVGKVFWHGRHQRWRWTAPMGKIHKQGMQLFEAAGWRKADLTDAVLPVFCWCTRQADFPSHGDDSVPLIRPFPQAFTRLLDDKLEFARCVACAGLDCHPQSWPAEDFLHSVSELLSEIWFLKHAQGVKGNAVHLFADAASLRQRLEEMGESSRRCFLVQRGVLPPALAESGRKWVLRAHVLLHGSPAGLRAYCHRDIIRLEHGHVYTPDLRVKAAHVSNAGSVKHWPKPTLLVDEDLIEKVYKVAAQGFAAVWSKAPQAPYSPAGTELCQVFGLDVVLDAHGRAWLIEVNSYPAIYSGTMEHVDIGVYTTLVRDVLRGVVLPRVDGVPPELGGFNALDIAQHLPHPDC